MTQELLPQRMGIATRVKAARDRLAREVNEEFFRRHPDWKERYGARGVRHGFEDACFHLDFLSAAIASGNIDAFAEYATWARRMLESRGIATTFLAENLGQVGQAATNVLGMIDRDYLAQFIDAAVAACELPLPAAVPPEAQVAVFVQSLLTGNRDAALNIAKEALTHGKTVRDIYIHILQPAMYEIGRLWETNQISVAREHMATAITQYVMAQLFPLLERPPGVHRGVAVVAGVEGELHQLGALMVADMLESDGWQARFLGSNMPHSGIVEAIRRENATLVGISATVLSNVPKALDLIIAVRTSLPAVRILVGGAAFKSATGLWKEAGADGFAPDLMEAISVAQSLSHPTPATGN